MKYPILSLLCCLSLFSCKKETTLFRLLSSEQTGIGFNNRITESDSLNILKSEFIYNGGGVAIGDLNGDGLQDLFFTGNQVDNRLYLNTGGLQFEDITAKAGVSKKNPQQWSAGINLVDINADGRLDIYVCNTFQKNPELCRNLLYINQGNDPSGCPAFAEMAREYGLDSPAHTPNAQFFDYDNDGDMDVFLSVNWMDRRNPNAFREKIKDGTDPNCDRLLRNDHSQALGHPVFTDVSLAAGLLLDGYSHSALVSDFDQDGWLDIYVANDYVTNDLLYINQRDGTFSNRIADVFKHQAASAMGSDLADINNDGHLDLFTTEMLPYYNKRKKLFQSANNYAFYANNDFYGYEHQYPHNVLQLHRGKNPDTGLPVYSDVSFLTGTQETEWSWTPLMADFDNDGHRDIFVTNGFPKDITDHDFGTYYRQYGNFVAPKDLLASIPQVKVPKFMFRNEGQGLQFSDQSKAWGVAVNAFSNGAACGDLDNDGDLDLVVNNIDDEAFIFKNTLHDGQSGAAKTNFLRLLIEGDTPGSLAFGATATVFFSGEKQAAQTLSARGYSSASETALHFGLGQAAQADSIVVRWPGNRSTTLRNIAANQTLTIAPDQAQRTVPHTTTAGGWLKSIPTTDLGLHFVQDEYDFVDFDWQRTLPHKYSQYGPGLAIGDVNGDGLDDLYQGGNGGNEGMWFWQTRDGKFVQQRAAFKTDRFLLEEDLGVLLFDADSDGDLDLFSARGGAQNPLGSRMYQDILCVNDGKGHFKADTLALPTEATNGLAAKAVDYDGDGDLDLFVGGSMVPRAFPQPDRSYILRNDSQGKDRPRFTDVTQEVCPDLLRPGLVLDALWTDFDNDNRPDLLVAGEWMPLSFYRNTGSGFTNETASTGISDQIGWWTSLAAADFDNDGDMDYMAGNYGQNTYFQCRTNEPVSVYAKDFDNNGSTDSFISCFWKDSVGNRREYFYHTRDDMVKQLLLIRRKFYGYGDFGAATVQDVFSAAELAGATILRTNRMATSFVENLGDGKFRLSELAWQAQIAPVFGMLPYDINHDGLLDLLLVGNDFGMELLQGRADAFYGLVLKNEGNNRFRPMELDESRFFVPRNARALTRMYLANGKEILLATQNRDDMRIFEPAQSAAKPIFLKTNEVRAKVTLRNGQTRLMEFGWGSTFLSQQQRSWVPDAAVVSAVIMDGKGNVTREILEVER